MWERCVSVLICLVEEGHMCTLKRDLDTRLSCLTQDLKGRVSAHICENRLFAMDEFREVSHMFRDVASTRWSEFCSDIENGVSDVLQECSQMNTSRRSEKNSYKLANWTWRPTSMTRGSWILCIV
jgi:hypothetical protein